ncbi:hypothetical protein ROZALSC1DRAFT_9148, partial [Rozella allomycis CSF55]
HRGFNHHNYADLNKIELHDMVHGRPSIISILKEPSCKTCIVSKHKRLPFPTSNRSTSETGELILHDFCVPLPESQSGYKYYAIFIDHFS